MRKTVQMLSVKLSETEYKNLSSAAKAESKTVSAYVRESLLSEAEKKVREERKIYSELAQIILNMGTLKADVFARLAEMEARISARPGPSKTASQESEKTITELTNQVKKLQVENTKLRDDLAEANRNLAIQRGTKR